jgi:hypothetical protein
MVVLTLGEGKEVSHWHANVTDRSFWMQSPMAVETRAPREVLEAIDGRGRNGWFAISRLAVGPTTARRRQSFCGQVDEDRVVTWSAISSSLCRRRWLSRSAPI